MSWQALAVPTCVWIRIELLAAVVDWQIQEKLLDFTLPGDARRDQ